MSPRRIAIAAAVAALAIALYLAPIPGRGLIGPDEPRYASIARQMAESGDWITPVLWGEPWFEKPAMLFWLGALGHSLGLESLTRIPVALLSLAFLGFFFVTVRNGFGGDAAIAATVILGTSAGWVAYSDAGVFDAPLAVFTSAALLSLLPWVADRAAGRTRHLAGFGALLGLGVLSKGLVAPAVAFFALAPSLVRQPGRLGDLLGLRCLGAFAAVCIPWYLACYLRNGSVFVEEFIVRHHFERFVTSSLEHVQPWWFFGPVLLLFLLPWTPLLFGLRWREMWGDPRMRFLACWAVGTLLFFSISVNKLPAYILPSVPPLAILIGLQRSRTPRRVMLAAVAGTLLLVPLAATLLAPALADGIRRAWAGVQPESMAAGLAAGLACAGGGALVALRLAPRTAFATIGVLAALSLALLKQWTFPGISQVAGTREFHNQNGAVLGRACLGELRRHAAYGLRHYSRDAIPECDLQPRGLRIEGDPPAIVPGVAAGPRDGR